MFIDGEEAFQRWTDKDSLYGARNLAQRLHNSKFPSGDDITSTQLDRIVCCLSVIFNIMILFYYETSDLLLSLALRVRFRLAGVS